MSKLLSRLFPQPIKRRGILIESLIFVLIYIILLFIIIPDSPVRTFTENSAILIAAATAAVLVFFSLPEMPPTSQRAWLLLGIAQVAWLAGDFLMDYVQSLIQGLAVLTMTAHIFNLIGYCLAGAALLQYPFTSRHAPTRFRFILDAIISCGVVITLGFLLFLEPTSSAPNGLFGSLMVVGYPIADCILLMLLANFSLASWTPRATAKFLAAAWTAVLISDYVHSSLLLIGSYHPGGFVSLGWVCGSLLIGLGAVYEKGANPGSVQASSLAPAGSNFDLGAQFQKVLPSALVIVMFWYVLTDRQLRGDFSTFGLWMSAILGVMLIVRLGIRAGEAELNQYWQLFRNLSIPSFISDSNGNILLANPACTALTSRRDQSELPGSSLFDIFEGPIRETLGMATRHDQTVNATLRGRRTPYSLALSPLVTEDRRVLIAGVAHDLSEQAAQRDAILQAYDELQKVSQTLEDLNSQLEQKVAERTGTLQTAYQQLEEQNKILQGLDQIKSDFVSMVSHELRAPLTNLSGGLELLLKRQHNPADENTLLLIQAEIRRLARFVESILNISALEASRFLLHPIPLSLPLLVGEVRDGWNNLPEFGRIQSKLAEDLPLILADENALRSVFGHLIDNALKYASVSPVEICAQFVGQKIRVEVRDYGPGIPVDKRGLLFERFQRLEAKDSQAVYGYGLGLYLSQRLLQAMDSELHFEAPADGGALFYFHLSPAYE
jgi:signal transduction histidine kinase